MHIYDGTDVPDSYKVAFYDALARHFASTIDSYYTRDVEPDPRYDSGVEPAEQTATVLIELGEGQDADDLFVVMEVAGWVDFLGFRVELPTLTRDAMEWEGGGPEIDDRFVASQREVADRLAVLDRSEQASGDYGDPEFERWRKMRRAEEQDTARMLRREGGGR